MELLTHISNIAYFSPHFPISVGKHAIYPPTSPHFPTRSDLSISITLILLQKSYRRRRSAQKQMHTRALLFYISTHKPPHYTPQKRFSFGSFHRICCCAYRLSTTSFAALPTNAPTPAASAGKSTSTKSAFPSTGTSPKTHPRNAKGTKRKSPSPKF